MKKILSLLLLCTSFQCIADSTYIGIDYMLNEIEFDDDSAKPKATALRVGVSNNQMAFELQYLMANNTDNIYSMEFDLEKSIGLYFVMESDKVDGLGFDVSLGYAMTDMLVSGSEGVFNYEDRYKGFSWRVAITQQIPYLEQANVRLGYQSLYKNGDVEITGISLGFTYQF
jgi:hypothetical protein